MLIPLVWAHVSPWGQRRVQLFIPSGLAYRVHARRNPADTCPLHSRCLRYVKERGSLATGVTVTSFTRYTLVSGRLPGQVPHPHLARGVGAGGCVLGSQKIPGLEKGNVTV